MIRLDDPRLRSAEAVFQAVVDLPLEQRPAALDEQCGSDLELRAFVERLLRCDESWTDEIEGRLGFRPPAGPQPPFKIGRFRILRTLGEGGMGVVYEAEQEHPRRPVALKIMRFALPSRELVQRFAVEAEVLGQLNHPGIAQIYEAGSGEVLTADGKSRCASGRLPFVAMELVRGEPLLDFARRRNLSVRERLDLAARVCDAVSHAHKRAVIHRDLKPANILVDESGQPKILDFGVSRVMQRSTGVSETQTAITGAGQLIGTLAYMSPEQLSGDPARVDTRSDVYALGVLLYELLAGQPPHELAGLSIPEASRAVCESEPRPLSSLDRSLRGEVETIVHKAIARDKSRRYQSAADLADDIRRYLAGDPIEAKRDSTFYVLRKSLRRYKGPVAFVAVFALALAFTLVFSLHAWRGAARERDRAEIAAIGEREQRTRAQQQESLARRHLYAAHMNLAYQAWADGNVLRSLELLRSEQRSGAEDFRGFEWHYLWSLSRRGVIFENPRPLMTVAVSPDGRCLAVGESLTWRENLAVMPPAGAEPAVYLLDLESGQRRQLAGLQGRFIYGLAFSPDGTRLAGCGDGGMVLLCDLQSGRVRQWLHDEPAGVFSVAFSPSGQEFISASGDRMARVWKVADGSLRGRLTGHSALVHSAVFSPDGSQIATGGFDGTVRLWDAASYRQLTVLHSGSKQVWSVCYSPDGRLLACCGDNSLAEVWDIADMSRRVALHGHAGDVLSVAFSPDGEHLATAGTDQTARLWVAPDWTAYRVLRGHSGLIRALTFTPTGHALITVSTDGRVRRWDVRTDEPGVQHVPSPALSTAFSPDGRMLAAGLADGSIQVWASTGKFLHKLTGHTGAVRCLGFTPDGRLLASGSDDRTVRLWRFGTEPKQLLLLNHPSPVLCLALLAEGSRLVSGCGSTWDAPDWATIDAHLKLWDVHSGRELVTLDTHPSASITALTVSPDGKLLAAAGVQERPQRRRANWWMIRGFVEVWATRSWEKVREQPFGTAGGAAPFSLAISPGGSRLAVGGAYGLGAPGLITVWDTDTWQAELRSLDHFGPVLDLAFAPDQQSLVSAGYDRGIQFHDLVTNEVRTVLKGHKAAVYTLDFSPDGKLLASGGNDGTVRLWRAEDIAPAFAPE